MEGEHFGIAPVEGLASGCVTIVHNSGGMKEFIPDEYRWDTYDDLKEKIVRNMETQNVWELKRKELWSKIEVLKPETFEKNIWNNLQKRPVDRVTSSPFFGRNFKSKHPFRHNKV